MEVSQLPCFYGPIDAYACSGYQALLPRREGPGDEARDDLRHNIYSVKSPARA